MLGMESLDQVQILSKIVNYLKHNLHNSNEKDTQDFIRKFSDGYCSGISSVWLYSKWLQTQPETDGPRDDYAWFRSTVELIINWQLPETETERAFVSLMEERENLLKYYKENKTPAAGRQSYDAFINEKLTALARIDLARAEKLKKLINDNQQIERFISLIESFQDIEGYLPIAQGILEQILQDTKQRELHKEYSIASLLTLEQLKQLLHTENIIQEGRMVLIGSLNHATALFREGNNYYYFDPNSKVGEIQTASVDEVAKLIFDAHFFQEATGLSLDYTRPSPLGFRMFSFDAGPIAVYPIQAEVLDNIHPILAPIPGTGQYSELNVALVVDSLESVRYFLAKGMRLNINNLNDRKTIERIVKGGHKEIIEELLTSENVDPQTKNILSCTELMLAASYGDLAAVQEILQKPESDPNVKGVDGRTVLMVAAFHGYLEMVQELLKNPKVTINLGNHGTTALILAVQGGHISVVRELLSKEEVDLNAQDSLGFTALIRALFNGHLDIAQEILKNPRVDLTITDKFGNNALMWAASKGYSDVIRDILNREKANLNAQDSQGMTALMMAASSGHTEVVRELLKNHKINLDIKNKDNKTALALAIDHGHTNVAKLLLLFSQSQCRKKAFSNLWEGGIISVLGLAATFALPWALGFGVLVNYITIVAALLTTAIIAKPSFAKAIAYFSLANKTGDFASQLNQHEPVQRASVQSQQEFHPTKNHKI